jgi:hypothetical protein
MYTLNTLNIHAKCTNESLYKYITTKRFYSAAQRKKNGDRGFSSLIPDLKNRFIHITLVPCLQSGLVIPYE